MRMICAPSTDAELMSQVEYRIIPLGGIKDLKATFRGKVRSKAPSRKAVGVDPPTKEANLRRLSRIEGQVRGLARMIETDRYCADVLVQISSVQEALRAVGRCLMRNHLRHCASQAIRTGTSSQAEAMYDELMNLIYTHAR
jgi:CsoR family transcriptional regulator, copper-sensing transcriptional repressor